MCITQQGCVPKWLGMRNGKERLIAWLKWRGVTVQNFDFQEVLRDGSYDLFHTVSESDSKRQKLFKELYDTLEKQEFVDMLTTEVSDA